MRLLGKLIGLVLILLVGGFFAFVTSLPRASSFQMAEALKQVSDVPAEKIGIVALTGGGGVRIARALELYEGGVGARVLISGTHPDVKKAELAERFGTTLFDCCVDLGPRAQTTIGNAIETRDWARSNGYDAVWLVTHYYHLPRATMELKSVAPELVVIGVPVESPTADPAWYRSADAWGVLAREYGKFLLAAVRTVM